MNSARHHSEALTAYSRNIRSHVLRMAHAGHTPHVGSALSCVEILACLYFSTIRIDPAHPNEQDRDRFLMSKGHAAMALYAVLAERGFFPCSRLNEYAMEGGKLAEHPGLGCVPGVEAATGSLGHGLSIGAGLALAAKIRRSEHQVFVLLSDGECNEGSVWEAAIFASRYALSNLIAVVDYNKLSAMDRTEPVLEPLADKWRAFGWHATEINGHDVDELAAAFEKARSRRGQPSVVVAHTVKGKGVSFMENNLEWHYRPPSGADLERALEEVQAPSHLVPVTG